jgi:hypothetical protein
MKRALVLPLTVVALLVPVLAAGATAAPTPCTVSISIADPSKEAAVGSNSADAVQFAGNFSVTLPPLVERASLTLTSEFDTGWVATVSPASITLTSTLRTGMFTITVVAPAGVPPTLVGTGNVVGHMNAAGAQCSDTVDGLTVTPLPYLEGISGNVEPRNVTVNNGLGSFTLTLGAIANVPVTLTLEYGGPSGVTITGPATLQLQYTESGIKNATDKVQVRAPDLPPGNYHLNVTVRASTSNGLASQARLEPPLVVALHGDPIASAPVWIAGVVAIAAVGAAVWWRRR